MLNSSPSSSPLFIGLPPSSPRVLIPLAVPSIQCRSFNLYSPGSIQGKLFKWVGRSAARAGLMRIMGHFVAAPIEAFNASENIQPILKNQLITSLQNDWAAALGQRNISVALSLGEPSHYRKVTALIFDGTALPVAFAKIACTPQAKSLILNETEALKKISNLHCTSVIMPRYLGQGQAKEVSWLLQSTLLSGRPSRNDLRDAHFSFLTDLAQKTKQLCGLISSDLWKYLCNILEGKSLPIKADFAAEALFLEKLGAQIKSLNSKSTDKPWPFTNAHGDFAPWNMRLIEDKVALYDWEYFIQDLPAGWDLLYFIFRVENLIKRLSLQQIWKKFEKGAYSDKIEFFEKKASIEIPEIQILAMLVILSISLDLIPKMIIDRKA